MNKELREKIISTLNESGDYFVLPSHSENHEYMGYVDQDENKNKMLHQDTLVVIISNCNSDNRSIDVWAGTTPASFLYYYSEGNDNEIFYINYTQQKADKCKASGVFYLEKKLRLALKEELETIISNFTNNSQ